jgi:hypothetical protein
MSTTVDHAGLWRASIGGGGARASARGASTRVEASEIAPKLYPTDITLRYRRHLRRHTQDTSAVGGAWRTDGTAAGTRGSSVKTRLVPGRVRKSVAPAPPGRLDLRQEPF